MKRGAIVCVLRVDVGSVLNEKLAHRGVAVLRREHQRSLAAESAVGIAPAAQRSSHASEIAVHARLHQIDFDSAERRGRGPVVHKRHDLAVFATFALLLKMVNARSRLEVKERQLLTVMDSVD